ncbi:MAG: DNA polymerase III subunit delta' [Anaerolineae bacterium]|nr:DNA polymerase III subunit delta' [Anaerolineae bacterium]
MSNHWPVTGHEWAVDHLGRAIQHDRMRHAYLFAGPDGIGKTTLARALAAAINCTGERPPCGQCRSCSLILKNAHPDVIIIEADQEGGNLKIDQVRELQQTLALRPYEARYRVAILRRFHEARPTTQDALLKTLEEPSANSVLILTTNTVEQLLPTILSRCQPLHLRPLPIETVRETLEWAYRAPQDIAKMLAQLSGGRIGWAIRAWQDPDELDQRHAALEMLESAIQGKRRDRFKLVEQIKLEKPQLLALLEIWQGYWRDVLLVAGGSHAPVTNYDHIEAIKRLAEQVDLDAAQQALTATRRTMDYLGKNVNARLALETLMLDYPTGKLI